MAYVPLETLIDKSQGSMFKLVMLVSKRALELADGAPKLIDAPADTKITTLAMMEMAAGVIEIKKDKKKAQKE